MTATKKWVAADYVRHNARLAVQLLCNVEPSRFNMSTWGELVWPAGACSEEKLDALSPVAQQTQALNGKLLPIEYQRVMFNDVVDGVDACGTSACLLGHMSASGRLAGLSMFVTIGGALCDDSFDLQVDQTLLDQLFVPLYQDVEQGIALGLFADTKPTWAGGIFGTIASVPARERDELYAAVQPGVALTDKRIVVYRLLRMCHTTAQDAAAAMLTATEGTPEPLDPDVKFRPMPAEMALEIWRSRTNS